LALSVKDIGQMNKGLRDQTEILKSLFTLRAGVW